MRFLISQRIKWLQTWVWNPKTSFAGCEQIPKVPWLWFLHRTCFIFVCVCVWGGNKHGVAWHIGDAKNMIVLCYCLWAGRGSYSDTLQLVQDPQVTWLPTWLGSLQKKMEALDLRIQQTFCVFQSCLPLQKEHCLLCAQWTKRWL